MWAEPQRRIERDARLAFELQLELIQENADRDITAVLGSSAAGVGPEAATRLGYGSSSRQVTLTPLTDEPRHTRGSPAVKRLRRMDDLTGHATPPQPLLLLESPTHQQPACSSLKRRMRMSTCLVCLEDVEPAFTVCCKFDGAAAAPLDPSVDGSSAISATFSARAAHAAECEHWLCPGCMRRYLRDKMHEPQPQLRCCAPGCTAVVPIELATRLLGSGSEELRKLIATQAEAVIPNKVYCPNPACAAALEAPSELDPGLPFARCPHCLRGMCVECGVAWHEGLSCERYRTLPPEMQGETDLAALALAREKGLRCCPACREGIERQAGDCNYVKCRCGCGFCYACGVKYVSDEPTTANWHGVPGCQCGLFGNVQPHADAAAVVLLPSRSRSPNRRHHRYRPRHPSPPPLVPFAVRVASIGMHLAIITFVVMIVLGIGIGFGIPTGIGVGVGIGIALPTGIGIGIGIGIPTGISVGIGLGLPVCIGVGIGIALALPIAISIPRRRG